MFRTSTYRYSKIADISKFIDMFVSTMYDKLINNTFFIKLTHIVSRSR